MTPTTPQEVAEKLERFIAMPEWPRFYMDKEQAQICVDALAKDKPHDKE